jgi:hypothetical protein
VQPQSESRQNNSLHQRCAGKSIERNPVDCRLLTVDAGDMRVFGRYLSAPLCRSEFSTAIWQPPPKFLDIFCYAIVLRPRLLRKAVFCMGEAALTNLREQFMVVAAPSASPARLG